MTDTLGPVLLAEVLGPEITNTIKLVISAIIGGVTVFPLIKAGLSKDDEQRIAWMFFAIAIATFIFFEAVVVIIAVVAGILGFLRIAPVLSKEGVVAVQRFRNQIAESRGEQPRLSSERPNPLAHLEDQMSEEERREMEEWLRGRDQNGLS